MELSKQLPEGARGSTLRREFEVDRAVEENGQPGAQGPGRKARRFKRLPLK